MKILYFNLPLFLFKKDYIFDNSNRLISKNFYYLNCYFSRINIFNGNGGIIYINNKKTNLILNNCIFYYCSCTVVGGAICFYCFIDDTIIEFNKICINHCFAFYDQFSRIETSINSKNLYNLLSISNCYNNSNGHFVFSLFCGNIHLSHCNSTKNINFDGSGISIFNPTTLNSIYCTIINNYVSSNTIILLNGNNNHYLSYYNIINNNSPFNGIICINDGKYN